MPSDGEYADDDLNAAGHDTSDHATGGHDGSGYGTDRGGANGYASGARGTNGYAANGYAPNDYGPGGYASKGYADNGYADNGYGSGSANGSSPNGSSAGGTGQGGYRGDYDYSEPFEYFENPEGQQSPPTPETPAQWADRQPPPHDTSDTIWLGVVRKANAEPGAPWFPEPADPGSDPEDVKDGGATARRPGGRAERRRAAKRIKRRRRLSVTREVPILIVVALLIAFVLKTFLVQAFVIPSGSMEETIRIGDRVLVDKLTPWFGSKPQRGEVVVFKDPSCWLCQEKAKPKKEPVGIKQGMDLLTDVGLLPSANEQDLIKRVVAVGGDHVACCDRHGRVTVNGTPLHEPYLYPGNKPSEISFDVHVPINRIFVLGDHRALSADSRYHLREPGDGTVPEDNVVGRAVVIAWPFDHWRRLEEPPTFASVHNAPGAAAAGGGPAVNRVAQLPSPAELPLVIGLVGLSRMSGRRMSSVRSNRGGLGGRRSFRFWRRRGRWRRWIGRRAP